MMQVGIVFSFDGASRGNPGKPAWGCCGWRGYCSAYGVHERELLSDIGKQIGVATNIEDKVAGLSMAVRMLLRGK